MNKRLDLIFSAFERLPTGGSMELITDQAPEPLKAQFQMLWTGQFGWEVVENGPLQWMTRISRLAAPKTCCGCCGG